MIKVSTSVAATSADSIFSALKDHIVEHGFSPSQADTRRLTIEHQGNVLSIKLEPDALAVDIEAVSANALFFLKEAVAHHLEECDPEIAAKLRWPDHMGESFPPNFRELIVLERLRPIPGMTRLWLKGENFEPLTQDGMHVKLMLPAQCGRLPAWPGVHANGATRWPKGEDRLHVRYFTLRHVNPEAGKIAIDFMDHAGGNISDWAASAVEGDVIGVMGPGGGLPLKHDGRPAIIGGDMTALPAIARMLEEPECPLEGHLLVEMPQEADAAAYLPASGLKLHRFGLGRFNSEAPSKMLELAANGWQGLIWFGAEHGAAEVVRNHLKSVDFDYRSDGQVVAYWRAGIRGDARRED